MSNRFFFSQRWYLPLQVTFLVPPGLVEVKADQSHAWSSWGASIWLLWGSGSFPSSSRAGDADLFVTFPGFSSNDQELPCSPVFPKMGTRILRNKMLCLKLCVPCYCPSNCLIEKHLHKQFFWCHTIHLLRCSRCTLPNSAAPYEILQFSQIVNCFLIFFLKFKDNYFLQLDINSILTIFDSFL